MDLNNSEFELNQELNESIAKTPLAPFWEVKGYKARFFSSPITSSPEFVSFHLGVQITEGYLSPKADAPC